MSVFVFPGQGTQRPGMGRELFAQYRDMVQTADEVLGYSIEQLCLEAPTEKLASTRYCQPAIFTVSALSCRERMERTGERPAVALGHSLGEYNALLVAGAFDFATGLAIVKKRAELMSAVTGGGMAAVVGLASDDVERILREHALFGLGVAAYNSPTQTVLSGPRVALAEARRVFLDAGARAYLDLDVSGPFHSAQFGAAAEEFRGFLAGLDLRDPEIPVVSNVTAAPYGSLRDVPAHLSEQIKSPVRWRQSIAALLDEGHRAFVEIGESQMLTRLVDEIAAPAAAASGSRRSTRDAARASRRPAGDTFVDIVRSRAQAHGDAILYRFLTFRPGSHADEAPRERTLGFAGLERRARAVAATLQRHPCRRERALLLFEPGLDYVSSFFGCLFADVIPVPAYAPTSERLRENVRGILESCGAGFVLTSESVFRKANVEADEQLRKLVWIRAEDVRDADADAYRDPNVSPEAVAFLQYTSGSTSRPKGVMVTHTNLVANSEAIRTTFGTSSESRAVIWLPPFHDMGLIGGILQPLHVGFEAALMAPMAFLGRPYRWLKTISDSRATVSGGPNFAYELCARKIGAEERASLDLSTWTTAFNGAEPIRADTLRRFVSAFSGCGFDPRAVQPCYGLAENTLLVTGVNPMSGAVELEADAEALREGTAVLCGGAAATRTLIGCGAPSAEQRVAIVDPENRRERGDGAVGEIWVSGPCVASGYWGDEARSRETFQALTAGGGGPFLRTGDLGFMRDGQLYVTGRLKDLIIIRGRNYYPQDVEAVVEEASAGIRPGRVVAVSAERDGEERLAVVAEYKRSDREEPFTVVARIRESVSERFQIRADRVVLIRPASLPVTTSGKVRRRAVGELLSAGGLEPLLDDAARPEDAADVAAGEDDGVGASVDVRDVAQVTAWLRRIVARQLGLATAEVEIDQPLGRYGLESIDAIQLSEIIERALGTPFPPIRMYEHPTIRDIAAAVAGDAGRAPASAIARDPAARRLRGGGDAVAVIGMSGIFPGSADTLDLWKNLLAGRSLVSEVPAERWDWREFTGPGDEGGAASGNRWGGFADGMLSFDAAFFGISESEARALDPQQRKMLEITRQAIENAGYAPSALPRATGVFVGASTTDYKELMVRAGHRADGYAVTGTANSIIANRVSYAFDLRGPSETIDTACSSSLVAVHRAATALRNGECDVAIVGGVNAILSPHNSVALKNAGFLSPDGRCKTFDASADGYVRGEGCAAIVLKPLARARADGDPIYGVLAGSWANHGGRSVSLTAPSAAAQAELLHDAHGNAASDPGSIRYVEVHGTGTSLGDPIEVNGLKRAFDRLHASRGAPEATPYCGIGSVKTNVGHLEAAAGIAGLVKVLLSMKYSVLPASLNVTRRNPYIDLFGSPFYIVERNTPLDAVPGRRNGKPFRAGVSSFGFGGANCHVVVEELGDGARRDAPETESRPEIVVLSARTGRSLLDAAAVLRNALAFDREAGLPCRLDEIAHTLQVGRDAFSHRLAFVASTAEELLRKLDRHLERGPSAPAGEPFAGQALDGFDVPAAEVEALVGAGRHADLAQLWTRGARFDWSAVRGGATPRRCHLPGYAFDGARYLPPWLHAATTPAPAPAAARSASQATKDLSEAGIRKFLALEVARQRGLPVEDVRHEVAFYDLGMTSFDIIGVHAKLAEHLGREIGSKAVYACPSIAALARWVTSDGAGFEVDLSSEIVLPEELVPERPAPAAPRCERIFLTGATGFVGSYLLAELLRQTSATVHCLVRAASREDGFAKITDALTKHGVDLGGVSTERIEVMPGDISKELLGMSQERFDALGASVDVIYHCAAAVDWMKPYAVLKETNVRGTREVIRLACRGAAKPVHFISSLSVLPLQESSPENDHNEWREELVKDPRGITSGYGQSKWVCEHLFKEAMARGIPVTIYRFDFAVGPAGTGVMKDTDFIVRMLKGCIQLQCIPEEEVYFNVIAADHLCKMLVVISRDAASANRIFHVLNSRPLPSSAFGLLIKSHGYRLSKLPLELWKKLIFAEPSNALYSLYPFIKQYCVKEFGQYRTWRVGRSNTVAAFERLGPEVYRDIPSPFANVQAVMSYLIRTGAVPAPAAGHRFDGNLFYWESGVAADGPDSALVFEDAEFRIPLDGDRAERLAALCARAAVDELEVFLSIVAVICARFELASRCAIAIPVERSAERPGDEPSATVLQVEAELSGSPAFAAFVRRVHHQLLAEHEARDGVEIDRFLARRDGASDGAIYHRTAMTYRDRRPDAPPRKAARGPRPCDLDRTAARAALLFDLVRERDALRGRLRYDARHFRRGTAERLPVQLENILADALRNPDLPIFFLQKRVL